MTRLILAVLGGLIAAFGLVFITDALFHYLSPSASTMPASGDREAMGAYVASQPAEALAAIIAGWAIATFVGAAIAARVAGRGERPGWIVAGLFLLATAANFAMVPHPTWMVLSAIVVIVAAGWLGAKVGGAGRSGEVPA